MLYYKLTLLSGGVLYVGAQSELTATSSSAPLHIPTQVGKPSGPKGYHGSSCWHGPFNHHLCCHIQDPRCWDAQFTFAKCCVEEYEFAQSRAKDFAAEAVALGNRKGLGTVEKETWAFHVQSAGDVVKALVHSRNLDAILAYELVWEAANNLLAAVQRDSANLLAWQEAGKTMLELAVVATRTEFPSDPLYIYGLSMVENGCLGTSDMEAMIAWAANLQTAMASETSPWPKMALGIARSVRLTLTAWHRILEGQSSDYNSTRAQFDRHLEEFRAANQVKRPPLPRELSPEALKLVRKLMPKGPSLDKACELNPETCEEFGLWDLMHSDAFPSFLNNVTSTSTSPTSPSPTAAATTSTGDDGLDSLLDELIEQEVSSTPTTPPITKPKSTVEEEALLFPTKIVRRHFGDGKLAKRLSALALAKFGDFDAAYISQLDEEQRNNYSTTDVNNAFFGWQQRRSDYQEPGHHSHGDTPEAEFGQAWPELDNSVDVKELRAEIKVACADYIRSFLPADQHDSVEANVKVVDWISVLAPGASLAFHDHPMASVSGTFYAQVPNATPILFADPRGHAPYRYVMDMAKNTKWTPAAPFHKVSPVHVESGDLILFPPWLLHTVRPNEAGRTRVTYPFNCFFAGAETARLDAWFVTAGALQD